MIILLLGDLTYIINSMKYKVELLGGEGGSILIYENIPQTIVILNTNLQAVTVIAHNTLYLYIQFKITTS